jgi:hypothetical protein
MARRIELVIIGAQKAGTTSLKNYLAEHPAITAHRSQEFTWFTDESEHARSAGEVFAEAFGPERPGEHLIAKMAGLYTSPPGIARLRAHNPDCLLVLVVRDPVQRAWSAYNMGRSEGWADRDFQDLRGVIERGETDTFLYRHYIGFGLYAEHLRNVYAHFPPAQVLVVRFADLKRRPAEVCASIFERLGLAPFVPPGLGTVHNRSAPVRSMVAMRWIERLRREGNPLKRMVRALLPAGAYTRLGAGLVRLNRKSTAYAPMDPALLEYLGRFYRPHNEEFARMTGLDISGWTGMQ